MERANQEDLLLTFSCEYRLLSWMYILRWHTSRMHLITSSIFLPSLCALISPVSRSRLFKTYLAVSCIWAVARGQPKLDVKGFVEATKESANLPGGSGNQWG